MGIDNTINKTYLQSRISLQMKHCNTREHLHERNALTEKSPKPYSWRPMTMRSFALRSELIAAIHCTARSAFPVETYNIPHTDYNYQHDYDYLSDHSYYGYSRSIYHMKDFRLQYYINGNGQCTWPLLPTGQISSGLPAVPRLSQWTSQERHPRLSRFVTRETTL